MVDFKEMVAEAEKGMPSEFQEMLKKSFRGTETAIEGDFILDIPKVNADGSFKQVRSADLAEKTRWEKDGITTEFYKTKEGVTFTVIKDVTNNLVLADTFIEGDKKAHHYRYGKQNDPNQVEVSVVEDQTQAPVIPPIPTNKPAHQKTPEDAIQESPLKKKWVVEALADGAEKIYVTSKPATPRDIVNISNLQEDLQKLNITSSLSPADKNGIYTLTIAAKDTAKARDLLEGLNLIKSNKKEELELDVPELDEKVEEKPATPRKLDGNFNYAMDTAALVLVNGFTSSKASRGEGNVLDKSWDHDDKWANPLRNATYSAMDTLSNSSLALTTAGMALAAFTPVGLGVAMIGGLGLLMKGARMYNEEGLTNKINNNASIMDRVIMAGSAVVGVVAGAVAAPALTATLAVTGAVLGAGYMVEKMGQVQLDKNKEKIGEFAKLGSGMAAARQTQLAELQSKGKQ